MDDHISKPSEKDEIRGIPKSPGAAVINRSAITNIKSMLGPESPKLLPELIDYFVSDAERLQVTAEQAINDSKPEDLHRAAHTLKSTSASFGALALSGYCRELEMLAKSGDLQGAGKILSSISIEFDRVKADLLTIKIGESR